jgi:hypothetical protein
MTILTLAVRRKFWDLLELETCLGAKETPQQKRDSVLGLLHGTFVPYELLRTLGYSFLLFYRRAVLRQGVTDNDAVIAENARFCLIVVWSIETACSWIESVSVYPVFEPDEMTLLVSPYLRNAMLLFTLLPDRIFHL